MKKTLIILAISAAVIGATVLYAKAVETKTQRAVITSEKKDGQVTIVQQTAAPIQADKTSDALKQRCDEALDRVGQAEKRIGKLEERMDKLEGKEPEKIKEEP